VDGTVNLCQDHWDRLRAKIEERGLSHLVAASAETAAAQTADQFRRVAEGEEETLTPANFDPLINAMFAIGTNVMALIAKAGGDPLYLLGTGPEDPVTLPGGEGRTWPRCGLCHIGLAHELTCLGDMRCPLARVDGYAYMLDRAADDALKRARELGLVEA
jgi:hypothetical protein